eukprot:scaffold1228_cov115-Isochrysis_galbana.AAC.20
MTARLCVGGGTHVRSCWGAGWGTRPVRPVWGTGEEGRAGRRTERCIAEQQVALWTAVDSHSRQSQAGGRPPRGGARTSTWQAASAGSHRRVILKGEGVWSECGQRAHQCGRLGVFLQ